MSLFTLTHSQSESVTCEQRHVRVPHVTVGENSQQIWVLPGESDWYRTCSVQNTTSSQTLNLIQNTTNSQKLNLIHVCFNRLNYIFIVFSTKHIRQVQNTTSCHNSGMISENSIRISTVRGHAPYRYPPRNHVSIHSLCQRPSPRLFGKE